MGTNCYSFLRCNLQCNIKNEIIIIFPEQMKFIKYFTFIICKIAQHFENQNSMNEYILQICIGIDQKYKNNNPAVLNMCFPNDSKR